MEFERGDWLMSEKRDLDIEAENKKRRRRRSLAIAWTLVGFMVLFFIVTVTRLGGDVLNKPF